MTLSAGGCRSVRAIFAPCSTAEVIRLIPSPTVGVKGGRHGVCELETGYPARWREPGGRLCSKSLARLRDAEQFLRTQEAVDRGAYIDTQAGRISFADWAEARGTRKAAGS